MQRVSDVGGLVNRTWLPWTGSTHGPNADCKPADSGCQRPWPCACIASSTLQLCTYRDIHCQKRPQSRRHISSTQQMRLTKSTMKRTIRLTSPSQHALFLSYVANMSFNQYPTAYSNPAIITQSEFDHFYLIADALLNQFYPEQTISVTSWDPDFISPEIKIKLRRKNKLMRSGRVEEAEALSVRISKALTQHGKTRFSEIDGKTVAKDVWATDWSPRIQPHVVTESLQSHSMIIMLPSHQTRVMFHQFENHLWIMAKNNISPTSKSSKYLTNYD